MHFKPLFKGHLYFAYFSQEVSSRYFSEHFMNISVSVIEVILDFKDIAVLYIALTTLFSFLYKYLP